MRLPSSDEYFPTRGEIEDLLPRIETRSAAVGQVTSVGGVKRLIFLPPTWEILLVAGFLTKPAFYGLHSSTNNGPRVLSQRRYEALKNRKAQLFFGVEEDVLFSSLRIRGNGKSRTFVDGDGNDCTVAYLMIS